MRCCIRSQLLRSLVCLCGVGCRDWLMQVGYLGSMPVGDTELLLTLLGCLHDGWPSVDKKHVPAELRDFVLKIHARCVCLGACAGWPASSQLLRPRGNKLHLCVASCWLCACTKTGSDIAKHPHHIVALAYVEAITRYSAIFKSHPDFLPPVLLGMLGPGYVPSPRGFSSGLPPFSCCALGRVLWPLLAIVVSAVCIGLQAAA
jgi:hypothetical protein